MLLFVFSKNNVSNFPWCLGLTSPVLALQFQGYSFFHLSTFAIISSPFLSHPPLHLPLSPFHSLPAQYLPGVLTSIIFTSTKKRERGKKNKLLKKRQGRNSLVYFKDVMHWKVFKYRKRIATNGPLRRGLIWYENS